MPQSTKLFVVLMMLFLVYTTLKGHLQGYLAVLFAPAKAPVSSGGSGGSSKISFSDVAHIAATAAEFA